MLQSPLGMLFVRLHNSLLCVSSHCDQVCARPAGECVHVCFLVPLFIYACTYECVRVCVCVWVSALFMSCGWPWPCCLAGWHRQSEGVREQSLALCNTHTQTHTHCCIVVGGRRRPVLMLVSSYQEPCRNTVLKPLPPKKAASSTCSFGK